MIKPGRIARFKVEKTVPKTAESSIVAIEQAIGQFYLNASEFNTAAEAERKKARTLARLVQETAIKKESKREKKSRMEPEYSVSSLEAEIDQCHKNAKVLNTSANKERAKARIWEKRIQEIRETEVDEISYIDVEQE